jgi:hypothetical protein
MIFKGLGFFTTKKKGTEKPVPPKQESPYNKVADDLKKSAEELERATHKLQASFQARQQAIKKLVAISSSLNRGITMKGSLNEKTEPKPGAKPMPTSAAIRKMKMAESQLFEVYREACLNFIQTDKAYYFKIRNHSKFLSTMYKRHMGNLRYYDQELRKLKNKELAGYKFNEAEAFIANQVILAVNHMGREKFIKEGHQALYNKLCAKFLTNPSTP